MTDYLFAYNFLQMKLQVRMKVREQKTLNPLKDKTIKKKTKPGVLLPGFAAVSKESDYSPFMSMTFAF